MTTDAVGGVWTFAREMVFALSRHEVSVSLAILGPPPSDAQRRDLHKWPLASVHHVPGDLEWMPGAWDAVDRAGDVLVDVAAAVRADVVHLNGYAHGALPFPVPVVVTGHSCVLSWWQAVRGEEAPPEWATYRGRVAAGLRAAAVVTAPTAWMAGELARLYGLTTPVITVPNGRTPAPASVAPKEPMVVSAGRVWDEAKNVATLGRAAAAVPWPVVVAGDAAHPDGGDRTPEGVTATGPLTADAVLRLFARAAVFALPTRYEPFGLAALEAAQAGCALVLGDIGSLREVWDDSALFVPPDDHDAWAAALRRLADDPTAREEWGRRARHRSRRYTAESMAAGYRQAYRAALASGAPEPKGIACAS